METLLVPQGAFTLHRYPLRNKETLRAWDAADEYLLQQLADENLPGDRHKLLIVNDSFGALSTVLAEHNLTLWSDSYLAHRGTLANLQTNNKPHQAVTLLESVQTPTDNYDLVLIKVPKTLALLEDQLYRLRPHLHPQTRILASGMVKGIHTSTLKLFEKIIGPTTTSLARKKARLIFSELDPNLAPGNTPYPQRYVLDGTDYNISNHANVFSREKLDIGTRFFLQHIPSNNAERIIDLGCGNGLVGLIAAERNPNAEVTFIDESFMAVASARANFEAARPASTTKATFLANDCLTGIAENHYHLILNNPPFHQQHTVGDFIAWQMFQSSRKCLQPGGELWVIGNRHLGYHVKLKRLFGNCETVASNNKFVVLKAVKTAVPL